MPYSRPLLATDLSDASRAAARLIPLLSAVDAKGRAVMVLPHPDVSPRVPRDEREEIRAQLELRREDAQRVVREWLASERVSGFDVVIRQGSVVRMIAREAETADIVALGSTGASRFDRVLLGSVARGVMRRVGCDTLVARPLAGPIRRILLATDFQASSRAATDVAGEIAESTGASVELLHVIDPGVGGGLLYPNAIPAPFDTSTVAKYALDEIHRINRQAFRGEANERIVHGRPAHAIVTEAKGSNADLVIIGSHGEGLASRILLGSVAEAVAERSPSSVLVVRPRRTPPPERSEPTEDPS